MSVDWERVRAEFPALRGWTFLNSAAFGQLPVRATEAVARHFAHRDELACMDFLDWFDDADRLRRALAKLIHASPEDIAFVSNASAALGMLLGGIDWRPGDRVVTLKDEFPNNLYHPALLQRLGVEFVETPWEQFYQAVNERTRLVAMSTVNYATGFHAPVAEIGRYLREHGVVFYLDGTQSVGALEFDVNAALPDVFAVHGYKWLLCPNGAGFVYVRPEMREQLQPTVVGWRSHRDWRNVDNLHHGAPEFTPAAEKYEGGMLNFALLYAMEASVCMMLEIGPALIEQRVMGLAEDLRRRLRSLRARLPGDESPHFDSPIVCARFDGVDASRLARALKARRVLVSARHGHLRVSPHFYNNTADLDRFEAETRALL